MKSRILAWNVSFPASVEGPIEHPAGTETLRASDGWNAESVGRFVSVNHGQIVSVERA